MAAAQPLLEFSAPTDMAIGGGLEGAERTSRETFAWNPVVISPDQPLPHV